MKSIKKNAYILIFVTVIVLFFVLKDDFSNVVSGLLSANIFWILIACLFMVLNWASKTYSKYLIAKNYKKDIEFFTLFKQTLITHFFCGVTPFSTGGEPMEIYMLKKTGLKLAHATSVVIQNFIMYQVVLVLYGILAVLINSKFHLIPSIPVLREIVVLGFIINCIVAIGLFLVCFSRKISSLVLKWITNIGSKVRLIKDKEKFKEKNQKRLDDFHECAKLFKKEKLMFVKIFINNFIGMGFYYIIPFVIIYSLGMYHTLDILSALVCTAFVMLVSNFVPIPGASGGIEYGFTQFYGVFVVNPELSVVLIIWRFITYYLGMILGAIMLNFFKGSDEL